MAIDMTALHVSPPARRLPLPAIALAAALTASAWAPQARADNSQLQTLVQRNNCTACHLIDKRKYGPTFLEVAARYAGDAEAAPKLAAKIRAGGSGVWGEEPMPPQPQVSEADARTMAELVLALKP